MCESGTSKLLTAYIKYKKPLGSAVSIYPHTPAAGLKRTENQEEWLTDQMSVLSLRGTSAGWKMGREGLTSKSENNGSEGTPRILWSSFSWQK